MKTKIKLIREMILSSEGKLVQGDTVYPITHEDAVLTKDGQKLGTKLSDLALRSVKFADAGADTPDVETSLLANYATKTEVADGYTSKSETEQLVQKVEEIETDLNGVLTDLENI